MNGTTIGWAISALILLGSVSGSVHAATQTRASAFTYNVYGQIEVDFNRYYGGPKPLPPQYFGGP